MSHRTTVLEYSKPQITDGVVKGVKIIGIKSKNGYSYTAEALKGAVGLYENAAVFIMHGSSRDQRQGSRKLYEHFGSLKAIRERQNGAALYGDLHIKESHPLAKAVIESIEDGTAEFGLSHNARCDFNADETEVVKIFEVNSVDLVDKPGTTHNLFESEDEMSKEFQDTLLAKLDGIEERIGKIEGKQVTEAAKLPTVRPKRITALEQVVESDDAAGNGEGLPVYGVSHEDFLAGLTGIRKGVTQ